MRKTKILFLIPNLEGGGAEKVLTNLVNRLSKQKYEVSIQTLFDVGVNKNNLDETINYIPGFKRELRGNSYIFKLFPSKMLYKYFIREHYDLVISFLESSTTRIVSGCNDINTRTICWRHSTVENARSFKKGFFTINGTRNAYERYDQIICVSEDIKKSLQMYLREKKDDIQVLHNINDVERIWAQANENIEDISFDSDCLNIISVGKIMPNKGYDRLARVHKRLLSEGIKNRIVILGEGYQRNEIQEYLIENKLEDSFLFLGYKKNPYKYLLASDVYVCSSHREGLSTSVTEALFLGVAAISTNCGGAKELLGENNEFGIVVENSENGLYNGIKLLSDKQTLNEYKNRAKERGRTFYPDAIIQSTEQMIDNVLNKDLRI